MYESGVLNSSGDFAVVEESISNDGDASSGDIGSDPSHGEAKATTSSRLEFLIVDGLEVGELVGHWNELVRGGGGGMCCPLDFFKISAVVVMSRSSSGEGDSGLW